VIPPVAELAFVKPPGDVHIKYGYLQGGESYVVKIASGFYDNPQRGLPSSQGLMLLFSQQTGQLQAVLLDEGTLTDARTGAAGAVAAKYLAPERVEAIGIVGTGTQARCQLDALRSVTDCRCLRVWGRREDAVMGLMADARQMGYTPQAVTDLHALASQSDLLVTTTPSSEPLLRADWITPGTHITAVGADTAEKQELDASILARAHRVVADSVSQCMVRGEIYQAARSGVLDAASVVELGDVIAGRAPGRSGADEITVADLTGVAVQDLAIARAVFQALE